MAISTIDNNGVNLGQLGSRNIVTNGSMQVAQRSTSETGLSSTNSYKTVDRYTTYISSLGTWTQSQDTDAPSGFGHSLKMLCTTADASPASTNRMLIQTNLEGQDIQSLGFGDTSNTYTVSFYVKSNVTGTYILEHLGGTASATNHQISTSYTVNNANTWERKTITLNVDSGAMTSDNTGGLTLSFWLGTGSNYSSGTLNTSWSSPSAGNRAVGQVNLASATNNYWQITGIQLEAGDTATPFEHRSYGDELLACQRYCWRVTKETTFHNVVNMAAYNAVVAYGVLNFPVKMRTSPTFTHSGVGDFLVTGQANDSSCTSLVAFEIATNNLQLGANGSGSLTQGSAYWVRFTSSSPTGSEFFQLDAEL
jgi:hypothetical protein